MKPILQVTLDIVLILLTPLLVVAIFVFGVGARVYEWVFDEEI